MKKYFVFIISTGLIIACNNNKEQETTDTREDTVTTYTNWEAGLNDSTGKLEVKKSEQPGPDTLSAEAMIRFLNNRYPNVQLKFIKTSGDTIYVSIPEATYLTQQMGSTGPQLYFADAVYNLTEIPGIHYVNFDFAEGDHAAPDILNRDSFKDE